MISHNDNLFNEIFQFFERSILTDDRKSTLTSAIIYDSSTDRTSITTDGFDVLKSNQDSSKHKSDSSHYSYHQMISSLNKQFETLISSNFKSLLYQKLSSVMKFNHLKFKYYSNDLQLYHHSLTVIQSNYLEIIDKLQIFQLTIKNNCFNQNSDLYLKLFTFCNDLTNEYHKSLKRSLKRYEYLMLINKLKLLITIWKLKLKKFFTILFLNFLRYKSVDSQSSASYVSYNRRYHQPTVSLLNQNNNHSHPTDFVNGSSNDSAHNPQLNFFEIVDYEAEPFLRNVIETFLLSTNTALSKVDVISIVKIYPPTDTQTKASPPFEHHLLNTYDYGMSSDIHATIQSINSDALTVPQLKGIFSHLLLSRYQTIIAMTSSPSSPRYSVRPTSNSTGRIRSRLNSNANYEAFFNPNRTPFHSVKSFLTSSVIRNLQPSIDNSSSFRQLVKMTFGSESQRSKDEAFEESTDQYVALLHLQHTAQVRDDRLYFCLEERYFVMKAISPNGSKQSKTSISVNDNKGDALRNFRSTDGGSELNNKADASAESIAQAEGEDAMELLENLQNIYVDYASLVQRKIVTVRDIQAALRNSIFRVSRYLSLHHEAGLKIGLTKTKQLKSFPFIVEVESACGLKLHFSPAMILQLPETQAFARAIRLPFEYLGDFFLKQLFESDNEISKDNCTIMASNLLIEIASSTCRHPNFLQFCQSRFNSSDDRSLERKDERDEDYYESSFELDDSYAASSSRMNQIITRETVTPITALYYIANTQSLPSPMNPKTNSLQQERTDSTMPSSANLFSAFEPLQLMLPLAPIHMRLLLMRYIWLQSRPTAVTANRSNSNAQGGVNDSQSFEGDSSGLRPGKLKNGGMDASTNEYRDRSCPRSSVRPLRHSNKSASSPQLNRNPETADAVPNSSSDVFLPLQYLDNMLHLFPDHPTSRVQGYMTRDFDSYHRKYSHPSSTDCKDSSKDRIDHHQLFFRYKLLSNDILLQSYSNVQSSPNKSTDTKKFKKQMSLIKEYLKQPCYYFIQYRDSSNENVDDSHTHYLQSLSPCDQLLDDFNSFCSLWSSHRNLLLFNFDSKVSTSGADSSESSSNQDSNVTVNIMKSAKNHGWDPSIVSGLCCWQGCVREAFLNSDSILQREYDPSNLSGSNNICLCKYHTNLKNFIDILSKRATKINFEKSFFDAKLSNFYLPKEKMPSFNTISMPAKRDLMLIRACSAVLPEFWDGTSKKAIKQYIKSVAIGMQLRKYFGLENKVISDSFCGRFIKSKMSLLNIKNCLSKCQNFVKLVPPMPVWAIWKDTEAKSTAHDRFDYLEAIFSKILQTERTITNELIIFGKMKIFPSAELQIIKKETKTLKELHDDNNYSSHPQQSNYSFSRSIKKTVPISTSDNNPFVDHQYRVIVDMLDYEKKTTLKKYELLKIKRIEEEEIKILQMKKIAKAKALQEQQAKDPMNFKNQR